MGLKCGAIKSILGNIFGISFKQLWEQTKKNTGLFFCTSSISFGHMKIMANLSPFWT
jgi:hypothetical protein